MVLDGTAEEAAKWSREIGATAVDTQFIGVLDLASPVFTEWAAKGFSVIVAGAVWPTENLPDDWVRRYREVAGAEPGLSAPVVYDGMKVLLRAAENAAARGQLTRAGIAIELSAVKLEGLTGPLSFDSKGQRAFGALGVWRAQSGRLDRLR